MMSMRKSNIIISRAYIVVLITALGLGLGMAQTAARGEAAPGAEPGQTLDGDSTADAGASAAGNPQPDRSPNDGGPVIKPGGGGPVLTNAPDTYVDTNIWRAGQAPATPTPVYTWFTNVDGSRFVATNSFPSILPTASTPSVSLQPRVEITPDGAVLDGGAFRVLADGNLNHPEALQIWTPGSGADAALRLHVTALAASSARTGKRIWLGTLRDSQGVVLSDEPIRILWTNAFTGIQADCVLQYNINSIVQEIYLREPVMIPEEAGLDLATLRIEVWSEVFGGPDPAKRLQTISLVGPNGLGGRAVGSAVDKQAADVELDWGASRMIQGSAFRVNPGAEAAAQERWPVAKQWVNSDNRKFIVESVDYESMQPALESLRTASLPGISAAQFASASAGTSASGAALPAVIPATPAQPSQLSLPPVLPIATAKVLLAQWDAGQTATWSQMPGINLDWTMVNGLLMNLDMGGSVAKVGMAAVGKGTSDFWNLYQGTGQSDATLSNLRYADNSVSSASLRVQSSAPQYEYYNSTGDAMYDRYLYCYNTPITLTFNNLSTGQYDIYLYGHGGADNQNGNFTLNGVSKQTAIGPYWNGAQLAGGAFIENTHYVVFRAVPVTAGVPLVISVGVNPGYYAEINGVQIAAVSANAPPVPYAGLPQTITYPASASLQGSATDDYLPPGTGLTLAWSAVGGPGTVIFNPASGSGGTLNSTASFGAAGNYQVRLTASDGDRSASSDVSISVNALGQVYSWSLKNDWSDAANPNGRWSYRQGTQLLPHWGAWQQLSGDFTSAQPAWVPAETGNTFLPAWFKVTTANGYHYGFDWQAGDIVVHTSSPMFGYEGAPANIAWTCLAAGNYNVAGAIWTIRQIANRAQHWTLYKNSTVLASGSLLSTHSRVSPCTLSGALNNLSLAANDVISLEIVHDTSNSGDYVGVNLTVAPSTPPANTAPTITPILDQSTFLNTPVGPLSFTANDAETPAYLSVIASSSNPTLVPNDAAHLALTASGTAHTLTVTPATGQSGSATIQVTASDGALSASTSFLLTVSSSGAASWSLNSGWSDVAPQSGCWAYRQGTTLLPHWPAWQQLSGDFTYAQPAWVQAETGNTFLPAWFKVTTANGNHYGFDWQAGDVVVHTSSPMYGYEAGPANITWTCPSAGTFNVSGGVWTIRQMSGRAQHWTIYKNGVVLASGSLLSSHSRVSPCTFGSGLNNLSLAANDVISLEIVRDSGNVGDYVGANLTIATSTSANVDTDGDGLPDTVDAYPTIPDTTLPSFSITSPAEGAQIP